VRRKSGHASFLIRLSTLPPPLLKSPRVLELVAAYRDLERTLRELRRSRPDGQLAWIDMPKLIERLSHSKRRLERKISNTLLLETQQIKTKLRRLAQGISHRV